MAYTLMKENSIINWNIKLFFSYVINIEFITILLQFFNLFFFNFGENEIYIDKNELYKNEILDKWIHILKIHRYVLHTNNKYAFLNLY